MTLDVEIPPVAIGWTLALVAEESYAHASFIVPVNAMGNVIIADISEPIELPPPWLYADAQIGEGVSIINFSRSAGHIIHICFDGSCVFFYYMCLAVGGNRMNVVGNNNIFSLV